MALQQQGNQFISRLFQLITYMAEYSGSKVQQIAIDTKIPQATVLRYLNSLTQEGYVFRDAITERYYLTWRICGIGEKVRAHLSLRLLAGNMISDLSNKLRLSIALVVENNWECMYLDCVYDINIMGRTLQCIGKQTPMHSTSSGKLLLSQFKDEELERFVAEKGLPALTQHTITTKEALFNELHITRCRGYAIDNEECEPGLRCISVPIYDYTGRIAAAMCCFGESEKLADSIIAKRLLPSMQKVAQEISLRLGVISYPLSTE